MSNQIQKRVQEDWVSVAKIGRSVGFRGEVFLHLLSDFPESLQAGNIYLSQIGNLTLEYYHKKSSVAKFSQIDSKESAKQIANLILYTTKEQSKEHCKLQENEFFWFDIVGSQIVEKGESLGFVSEIERFCKQDFLLVKTDDALLAQKFPKSFLVPYSARYILEVDSKQEPKIIKTQFCKEILENS